MSTCDTSAWSCDGNSTTKDAPPALIEGYFVLCMKDGTQGEWGKFDSVWDLNPYSGGGEATAWSPSAPLRLTASVTLMPPITAFSDAPTVVDVDVTFPGPWVDSSTAHGSNPYLRQLDDAPSTSLARCPTRAAPPPCPPPSPHLKA